MSPLDRDTRDSLRGFGASAFAIRESREELASAKREREAVDTVRGLLLRMGDEMIATHTASDIMDDLNELADLMTDRVARAEIHLEDLGASE